MARIFRAPIFQQPKQAAIKGKTEIGQNLLATTLGVVAVPFYQLDWPTQKNYLFRRDEQQQNLLLTTLGIRPFYQLDWATPQGYQRRVEWAYQNLLETTLVQPAPFYQLDWPIPKRNLLSVDPISQNLLESTLFQPPFAKMDWPNPMPARRDLRGISIEGQSWVLTHAAILRRMLVGIGL